MTAPPAVVPSMPAPSGTSSLAVDPGELQHAAAAVVLSGRALSAALPAVVRAWQAAASGLPQTATGNALQATAGRAHVAWSSCAEAVEAYALALQEAAARYRTVNDAATPLQRPAGTGQQ